jgi:hypothetical protein
VIRFVRNCGLIGLLVPVVVYPLWQSVNKGPFLENKVRFENIAMVLWPSSIFLMALQSSGSAVSTAFIVIVLLAANGVITAVSDYCCGASGEDGSILQSTRRADEPSFQHRNLSSSCHS